MLCYCIYMSYCGSSLDHNVLWSNHTTRLQLIFEPYVGTEVHQLHVLTADIFVYHKYI